MNLVGALLFLFASAVPAPAAPACAEDGKVILAGPRMEIRAALRGIAEQARLDIAVETSVRGRVTTPTECVPAETALRIVLGQVGAAYCVEGGTVYVSRSRRGCRGTLHVPRSNDRVSLGGFPQR